MKITSLKQQVKNPRRVSIFVDEKYSFSLSLDEIVRYRVTNGQELSAGEVKKFKKISEDGKLSARALEWLLSRPRSEREFRDYLRHRKVEPELSESLVRNFRSRNYLDERKFAQWLVEFRSRTGKSDRFIRSELFKKGISRQLADEVLAGEVESEVVRLRALIEKKRKLARYKNDQLKLAKYLTGQGFSYSIVKKELSSEEAED